MISMATIQPDYTWQNDQIYTIMQHKPIKIYIFKIILIFNSGVFYVFRTWGYIFKNTFYVYLLYGTFYMH
jgi:hypothetical protein